MFTFLWDLILYKPLLNGLAFLVSVVPGGDIGIAVILLTLLVKLILFPLTERQIRNQAAMNILTPELNKIKQSGASKEEQAKLTFALYKKHKTNPLAGCLVIIPTIFVLIALYHVFISGIKFDSALLYSFIKAPENTNMLFLGMIDLTKSSIILAIIAGASQYFQAHFMPQPPTTSTTDTSFQASFTKSMSMQMKYILPLLIAFIAYKYYGAVALYLITSNIFAIGQQIYVNKTERKVLFEEAKVLSH